MLAKEGIVALRRAKRRNMERFVVIIIASFFPIKKLNRKHLLVIMRVLKLHYANSLLYIIILVIKVGFRLIFLLYLQWI